MSRIIVLGEALIDLFGGVGVSLRASTSFQPSPGGAPANVAVALGKLDADVGFIGKVGQDEFGTFLRQFMQSKGVDVTHLTLDARAPTMLAVVALPEPNNPQFILYNGANELLTPEELPNDIIENCAVFVYGSVTLSTKSRETALQAAKIAKQAGANVIFDVNLRPNLWSDLDTASKTIHQALETATIIKANETEIEFLTGTSDLEGGSKALIDKDIQLCCVSLGDQGAYFRTPRASGYVPAFAVEAIDATGSGDAFVAGLAFQIDQLDKPLNELYANELFELIRFANACGALTATTTGAMMGSPKRQMVDELLNSK